MESVGFIGLGKMGSRMAKRILDKGYALYINDVIRDNAEALVKQGAIYVPNAEELARKTNVIFTSVPSGSNLKEIIVGKNGLLNSASHDSVLIDMSTIAPKDSAEIAAILDTKKIGYLRACVTGSTAFAEQGTLGIMVSGSKEIFEKELHLLKIIGNRQRYLGKEEQSRYMKISINMMIGTAMQMLAESLVLGEKAGIDWEMMVECIADSAAATAMIKAKEMPLKKRDWTAMSTVEMMEKDMNIALEIAAEEGLALPVTAITRQFYSAMRSSGYGKVDYSGILLVNEKLNNMRKTEK